MKHRTSAKYFGKLREAPVGSVQADGWLGAYLGHMATNVAGRLDECGYPFDTKGFACEKVDTGGRHGAEWWPYEQIGYWIDGITRCAAASDSAKLMNKARKQIQYVLGNAAGDGYLGPDHLRGQAKEDCRWGHVPFFRALMAYDGISPRSHVATKLANHYLSGTSKFRMGREPANVEQMCWAYGQTGNGKLLELAKKTYRFFDTEGWIPDCTTKGMLSGRTQQIHGVTFNEFAKLPAILYQWTGDQSLLEASVAGYETIHRDHMLVSGVHSSEEFLEGNGTRTTIEICDIADFTWSAGYLLQATGDVKYADWIERACLNAGTGAATGDFSGHQYLTSPNQILATPNSCHSPMSSGSNRMQYRPNPNTACCSGNVTRIMPNYVARMWMTASETDVAAVLYGPSCFTTRLRGQKVTITEETSFPFDQTVRLTISSRRPVPFALRLRIPGWAQGAEVFVNGRPWAGEPAIPGTFLVIDRQFADGDIVELHLPMRTSMSRWGWGRIAIERGPLVYSLAIKEKWVDQPLDGRSCEGLPPRIALPESPWNYGVDVSERDIENQVAFHQAQPIGDTPFSSDGAPVELRVPVRLIGGWEPDRRDSTVSGCPWHNRKTHLRGKFVFTPDLPHPCFVRELSSPTLEMARFIPLGCAKLRMTILPQCPNGSGRNDYGGRNPQTFI